MGRTAGRAGSSHQTWILCRVLQNSTISEFRNFRIPLRIVKKLYFPFCSRRFSIFGHPASFPIREVSFPSPHSMISTTSTLVAMIKGLVFSIKVLTIKSKTRQKVNQDMKRVDDVARMSAVGRSTTVDFSSQQDFSPRPKPSGILSHKNVAFLLKFLQRSDLF